MIDFWIGLHCPSQINTFAIHLSIHLAMHPTTTGQVLGEGCLLSLQPSLYGVLFMKAA